MKYHFLHLDRRSCGPGPVCGNDRMAQTCRTCNGYHSNLNRAQLLAPGKHIPSTWRSNCRTADVFCHTSSFSHGMHDSGVGDLYEVVRMIDLHHSPVKEWCSLRLARASCVPLMVLEHLADLAVV
jgi:hypothetical protein